MSILLNWVQHGSSEYWETVQLRREVLRQPLGLDFSPEELEAEVDQSHLGAWLNGELLGCLVLMELEKIAKMRQVAVYPGWQGHRIGSTLVAEFEAEARRRGCFRIELHARANVIPFYENLGYKQEGPEFEEVTIPHQKMVKDLPNL